MLTLLGILVAVILLARVSEEWASEVYRRQIAKLERDTRMRSVRERVVKALGSNNA